MNRKKHSNKYVQHLGTETSLCTTKLSKNGNTQSNLIKISNDENINVNFNVTINEESYNDQENDPIESFVSPKNMDSSIFVLPLPNTNTIMLSNTVSESRQAFANTEQKSLVVIVKILCNDGEALIVGCSICSNDFMLILDRNVSKNDLPGILTCIHSKTACSSYLQMLGCWVPQIKQPHLQEIILESMYEPVSESDLFCNELNSNYCGAIITNYGLYLFMRKNEVWRCVSCDGRKVNKCKHGQLVRLPFTEEFYLDTPNMPPIGSTKNSVLTWRKACCK